MSCISNSEQVLQKGGQLIVYEMVKVQIHHEIPSNREAYLPIQFYKSQTYTLPRPDPEHNVQSLGKKILRRELCPFQYHVGSPQNSTRSGIFLTGDHALWILGSEKCGIQIHRCQWSSVSAFTATTIYQNSSDKQSPRDFIMHTDAGPILTEWVEEYEVEYPMPMRKIQQGKVYSHVRYDTGLDLLVGAAAHPSKFKLFDEEGNTIWEPEGR